MKLSASDEGLKLKLGDSAPTGYGIQGLPGIYVDGPRASAPDAADSAGGLKLKLGDDPTPGAGIKGLPGIYVGGPTDTSATAAADSAGGVQPGDRTAPGYGIQGLPGIYVGGPAVASDPPAGMGIAGLPGIYLNAVDPAQAAQLAATATTLSGPERSAAEDAALQAARKNAALTAPTDDPAVKDYQREAQDYDAAATERQEALQKASEATGHVQADKAAIDYARTQVDSPNATESVKEAFRQMLNAAKSDEDAAGIARDAFEQTDAHLSITRGRAADALGKLAPAPAEPRSTPAVLNDASVVDARAGTPSNVAAPHDTASGAPPVDHTVPLLAESSPRPVVVTPVPNAALRPEPPSTGGLYTEETFIREAHDFCSGATEAGRLSTLRRDTNCEVEYAALHKNDVPELYPTRRNAEHYLWAKSLCDGTSQGRAPNDVTSGVSTFFFVGVGSPLYSLGKNASIWLDDPFVNEFLRTAFSEQHRLPTWAELKAIANGQPSPNPYLGSVGTFDEWRWANRGVVDCWLQIPNGAQ
jgi:hypothetical protein